MPSIQPRHLGLAFALSWSYFMVCQTLAHAASGASTIYFLAIAASLIVFASFARANRMTERIERFSDFVAGAGMAAAALLCLFGASGLETACLLLGAAIGGFGISWSYMRLSSFLAQVDFKYAATLVFASVAIASVLKTAIDLVPPFMQAPLLLAMAAGLIFCLRSSERDIPESQETRRFYNKRTIAPLWHLGAGIAVFSLMFGITQTTLFSGGQDADIIQTLFLHGSEAALAVITLVWAIPCGRGLNFSRNWRLVLMLMIAALILYADLPAHEAELLLAFVRTAQTFLVAFLLLAIVDIARHSVFHPAVVFAAGWICYAAPHALGSLWGMFYPAHSAPVPAVLSLIALLLIFVTLFLLDESSVGNHVLFSNLNDVDSDGAAERLSCVQESIDEAESRDENHEGGDLIDFKCSILSQRYSLTPREREVLALLAHGRSKAYIADAFIISENTVRGHVKRLYAKLDVHSKQELLDLVSSVQQ